MATMLGPDAMVDTAAMNGFVDRSQHHLAVPFAMDPINPHPPLSPDSSPRAEFAPANPGFVFPTRPSSSSAPSSFSRATGRRPRSAIELHGRTFGQPVERETRLVGSHALPDFSFNPGASLAPANSMLSPPHSPRAIPMRPSGGGHRRGGSEFVGGNLRVGESITVMSTSPTKSEGGLASPPLPPTKPAHGRRHAHRRSAAISSHDLTMILQPSSPNTLPKGSSVPASPACHDSKASQELVPGLTEEHPKVDAPVSNTSKDSNTEDVELGVETKEEPQPQKPACRTRVGFSDTLEFIPRPLSLVSSDTSSIATARPGHSASGSISSIISLTTAPVAEKDAVSTRGPNSQPKTDDARPSTAGAILDRSTSQSKQRDGASPRRRNSIPVLASLPSPNTILDQPSTPSPSKTPKRWSFFGLEALTGSTSPTRSRPASASSAETRGAGAVSAKVVSQDNPVSQGDVMKLTATSHKSIGKKSHKKPKKVKKWAGSILTRKSKAHHKSKHVSRRVQTPPPTKMPYRDDGVDSDDQEDEIQTVTPQSFAPADPVHSGAEETPKPIRTSMPYDDPSYPMIDLDAALGPFNTPLARNPEWEAAQRAGGLAKRQLHSAAKLRNFVGPGMHYHRRAESAPEMPPFEAGRFGIHRFGSSSTMADVFEEDEEEAEGDSSSDNDSSATPPASSVSESKVSELDVRCDSAKEIVAVSARVVDAAPQVSSAKRKGSETSESERPSPALQSTIVRPETSSNSLQDRVIPEETFHFNLESDRRYIVAPEPAASSPSPRHCLAPMKLAPVETSPLHLPTSSLAPISPFSLSHSSAYPSPRSPMSFDANRVSTAPSSVTEDTFRSLLMGEPGPEVRLSVDIPSLTSSNSTMTRESAFLPQATRGQTSCREPRPASFTSGAFGRRRSSLASLSRLISSSHGERSKLSMEVPMTSESDKRNKTSRAKRLSRMMQFWKGKEPMSTS